MVTKFFTIMPEAYGSSVWNLLRVTFLAPTILRWFLNVLKSCNKHDTHACPYVLHLVTKRQHVSFIIRVQLPFRYSLFIQGRGVTDITLHFEITGVMMDPHLFTIQFFRCEFK